MKKNITYLAPINNPPELWVDIECTNKYARLYLAVAGAFIHTHRISEVGQKEIEAYFETIKDYLKHGGKSPSDYFWFNKCNVGEGSYVNSFYCKVIVKKEHVFPVALAIYKILTKPGYLKRVSPR